MQPQTDVRFDKETFERLKKRIKNMSCCNSKDPTYATKLPEEVGLQLTSRCNLRCKHCFQWNDEGHFKKLDRVEQNEELPFSIVEKVFHQTYETRANLFLWGGEPMYYREWDKLANLLEKDPRWAVTCTNGLQIEEKLDSLLKISANLAMLISVEGLEEENDAIRGKNTYKKVLKGIELLLSLQNKGIYKGKVSINCTINSGNVGKLYSILECFEELGVDTVHLNFPWYIPEEVALNMDDYFRQNFAYLDTRDKSHQNSWHSYKYRIDPSLVEQLISEMQVINKRIWKIRVRYQPALELEEVRDFVLGKETPAQNRKRCLGVRNRMEVLANGKVSTCKLFPEFTVGDLRYESVSDIWHGQNFKQFREIHHNNGLMPICSKCIILYLNGR